MHTKRSQETVVVTVFRTWYKLYCCEVQHLNLRSQERYRHPTPCNRQYDEKKSRGSWKNRDKCTSLQNNDTDSWTSFSAPIFVGMCCTWPICCGVVDVRRQGLACQGALCRGWAYKPLLESVDEEGYHFFCDSHSGTFINPARGSWVLAQTTLTS